MLTVLGGLAEFERELIRARTDEGRARALSRGRRWAGRPSSPAPAARGDQAPRPGRGIARRHWPQLQRQRGDDFPADAGVVTTRPPLAPAFLLLSFKGMACWDRGTERRRSPDADDMRRYSSCFIRQIRRAQNRRVRCCCLDLDAMNLSKGPYSAGLNGKVYVLREVVRGGRD